MITTHELRHRHGQDWHAHDGGNVPHDHAAPSVRAFGRDGYLLEGLADASRGFSKLSLIILAVIVGVFIAKWAYTEYYVTTHCTMVLGTRVCQ